MKPITWLALAYQVPITPSKCRVYVWRKLKEFGACYLKQSVALLPRSQNNLARFSNLSQKIVEMGGEAVITEMKFIKASDEREMVARFQNQSESEYIKLIDDLKQLQSEIRQTGATSQYLTAKRMAKKFGQAKSRDFFRYRAEVARTLDELVGDMSNAADDLGRFFAEILSDIDE